MGPLLSFRKSDSAFYLFCLLSGSILLSLTTFFWEADGRYSVTASTLMFFSMLFWAVGFIHLFSLLKEQLPLVSKIGLLYAFYGVFGGVVFAVEGIFEQALGLSKIGVQASTDFPMPLNLVMFWSGPAFPLVLLVLGILLGSKKVVSWPVGILLSVAGLAFPLGRILRNVVVAHGSDFLLLAAIGLLVVEQLRKKGSTIT